MNIDFINDPQVIAALNEILELVGPSFNLPYDSDVQPSDGVERNDEDLTQYDVPGGTTLRSVQMPSANPSMAMVINSLLSVLAPVLSAYGFLLPILAIIKAIIEVICCLMNPFCVIKAVARLFKKYIPPFLSLFPPSAGMVIIRSTIKLIIAIVYYIMTEIVPTIQLIISLIECIINGFNDGNLEQANACKDKINDIITILANKIGMLSVMKPIMEIIFLILQLVSGLPCDSEEQSSCNGTMVLIPSLFDCEIDTACCDTTQCPDVISNPPSGRGVLIPTYFGDSATGWSWMLVPITGQENIAKLIPYTQDLKSQLDPQLDEEIDIARPIGAQYDAAHFRLRIMSRRGENYCVTPDTETAPSGSISVPIAKILSNNSIIVNNTALSEYSGVIDYCIEPNFEQLIAHNILSIGCHPDIVEAKAQVSNQFADIMEKSALARIPELAGLNNDFIDLSDRFQGRINNMRDLVDKPIGDFDLGDIQDFEDIQDESLNDLRNFSDNMKGLLQTIVDRTSDKVLSTLEVDKNIVKSNGVDHALIIVTPRDVSGTPIIRYMPDSVDVSVELFSDFGTIQNQKTNRSNGTITAELVSLFPGSANIMAKVNTEFVLRSHATNAGVKVEKVRFIADAILPKRRLPSKSKTRAGLGSDKEPGTR